MELGELPTARDEARLLAAMGAETANLHLATAGARRAIEADLALRERRWLVDAAERMVEALDADWRAWRRRV